MKPALTELQYDRTAIKTDDVYYSLILNDRSYY
jgi:hypothetical protein